MTDPTSAPAEVAPYHQHYERFKAGVRASVTWLHARAKEMNDPKAEAILNSAAFSLGVNMARCPQLLDERASTPAALEVERDAWISHAADVNAHALHCQTRATTAEADLAAMRSEVERKDAAIKAAAYLINRLQRCHAGKVVRDLPEATSDWETQMAALNASARNDGARQEGET